MKAKKPPKYLQGILWSQDIKTLDLGKDKNYIINQTLAYGDLPALAWLKKTYGLATIKKTFLGSAAKIYTPQALNFVSKVFLNLKNVEEKRYLKTTARITGSAAPGNI